MLADADPARAFMPYPKVSVPYAENGPLSGLSFGVKDLLDVAGYPTSAGSPVMLAKSGIKTRHAPVVEHLLAAGARFSGKTITDELAFSMIGKNAHFGTPVNGGAPDRVPGGSSSGSAAAVSNGLCDFALGTDTGGSVRAPASHCGLFGIRPTHGRISLEGCHDLAPSFDTCGYFARDSATFVRVGEVFFGPDPAPLPDGLRLIFPEDIFALLTDEVRQEMEPAVQQVVRAVGPLSPATLVTEGFDALYWAFRYIQGREAWRTDGAMIEAFHPPLGPGVAERFAHARTVTAEQAAEGQAVRSTFRGRLRELVADNGVIVLPTMPDIAPRLTDSDADLEDYRNKALNMLCLSVLSGLPQVSMPLIRRKGAPLGLSIMGAAGSDLSLVRLAARIAADGPATI
jgi:amidase